MHYRWSFGLTLALAAAGAAQGLTTPLAGSLADAGNTALVWSDLGAARFGDDTEIAQNVALYDLVVATSSQVTITSTGFAAGGVDPYFTLLAGAGTGASFLASNYDQAFSTGGDFVYSGLLAAGHYQIALGAYANMSFAENIVGSTLADGFIFLGETYALRDYRYALSVEVDDGITPVPEPASALLVALGLLGLAASPARRQLRATARR